MDIKSTEAAPLQVKAAGPDDGLEDGQFVAYASAFGNVDSYGDIVDQGAFKRTLGEWKGRGDTIPVLWGHDMQDAFSNIGGLTDAEEDDNGLKVTGQLDLENPTAAQVYRLLKGRRTTRMSFAYSVRDAETGDDGNHLKDLDLFEVSVVQVPANQDAQILSVKSAISPSKTATTDDEWDGPKMKANLSNDAGEDTYKQAFAWQDPDGDADEKSSYKFIHHMVSDEGEVGAANVKACISAIGILNGGRGGSSISDDDRQGVYDHLAKHLKDADQEPPELKSDPDIEGDFINDLLMSRAGDIEIKRGRSISAKNERKVKDAITALQDVLSGLGEEEDSQAGKASGNAEVKASASDETEGKSPVPVEEPKGMPSVDSNLAADIELLAIGSEA